MSNCRGTGTWAKPRMRARPASPAKIRVTIMSNHSISMAAPLRVAKNDKTELGLLPSLANRHGLITGATGTGKSVTLQTLAQRFSSIGVPVFMADVKGD